jgi:hypothetical protein
VTPIGHGSSGIATNRPFLVRIQEHSADRECGGSAGHGIAGGRRDLLAPRQ